MSTTITGFPAAAQVYGANAAPVATSASTLTGQPSTTGGNTAVSTGYSSTPASTVTGGGSVGGSTAINNLASGLVAGAVSNGQAGVSALTGTPAPALNQAQTNQVANSAASIATTQLNTAAVGGGAIGDALKSGVSGIVAFAQKGMADIQKAIQGDMAANNGEVDPAKMQLYTMKMSTYELLNQMAAKIQEKEERSIQVWLR
jgi:hypothetical protein